jgi:hydrogenase maturation protease
MTITIIGIGQSLRGDDAIGLEVVRHWQDAYARTARQPDIRVELAENPGMGLLNLLEGADAAILVDAVRSGAEPGTIDFFRERDIAAFLESSNSAHGWGVAETLQLGRQIDPDSLPAQIDLICIEVGQVYLGTEISPEVAAVIPKAALLIQRKLQQLIPC